MPTGSKGMINQLSNNNKPFKAKNSNNKNSVNFKETAACVSEFSGTIIHAKIDRIKHNHDKSKSYICCKENTHHHNTCPSFKKKHKSHMNIFRHKKNRFSTPSYHQRNSMKSQLLKSYNPNIYSYYYHRDIMAQICNKKPSQTQYNFQKIMKKICIHNRHFHTYKQLLVGFLIKNQFTTKSKFISKSTSNTVQYQKENIAHTKLRGKNQPYKNIRTRHTQVAYMS